MKIEIEITDREAQLLKNMRIPVGLCGSSVVERVNYLIDDMCMYLDAEECRQQQSKLYITMGLPDPNFPPFGQRDDDMDI